MCSTKSACARRSYSIVLREGQLDPRLAMKVALYAQIEEDDERWAESSVSARSLGPFEGALLRILDRRERIKGDAECAEGLSIGAYRSVPRKRRGFTFALS
jgi:hypothetical protein